MRVAVEVKACTRHGVGVGLGLLPTKTVGGIEGVAQVSARNVNRCATSNADRRARVDVEDAETANAVRSEV